MTAAEHFYLVDTSGRMSRTDKQGAIDINLAPILLLKGEKPELWFEAVSRFGTNFHLAAGQLSNQRNHANRLIGSAYGG